MRYSFTSTLSLALSLSPISGVWAQCRKLQFDGRIPNNFQVAQFDAANNIFNPKNVLGKDLAFSKILQLPKTSGSLFDNNGTQPLEVTIDDKSIFVPNADTVQNGFRRVELLAASNSGTDDSTKGVKTLHFSIAKDGQRALNLTHEYQLVFLEDNSFSTNQVVLKTGTVAGQNGGNPDTLQLFGNVKESPPKVLFSTPFAANGFHNFGITMDFNKNTVQVLFSTGAQPLKAVTQPIANDLSGGGQYHFGMLKKGLGGGADIVRNGVQPAGINEGLIYGGIFMEDSSTGCVSLAPQAKVAGRRCAEKRSLA
ncbi:hypothetical protein GGTG_03245 [Gaeumannomyces tritici R3-111a-1]|uniref:Glycoside hydrolase 131 catalytic N-terminal domain-containing protein n=1 Tax=Gaeumannomyces tritici (strain R3-111a-1) TaxID=644352 RepID=J3NPN8_GAET3|nr:hypothetical protein GGTG_03245 [Gaeumannomyces tritici R3-111a-1]EJT78143.1 hypothetical protein GGTG_03245 [Gaeumannomyces tritici R3-111a-1]